jgi:hypothetical protein
MTEVSPHYRLRYRLIANGVPEKDADAMATDWLNQRHKCHSVQEHLTMMLHAADRLNIEKPEAKTAVDPTTLGTPAGNAAREAALTARYVPWFGTGHSRRLACTRLRQICHRDTSIVAHFKAVMAEPESDARAALLPYLTGVK